MRPAEELVFTLTNTGNGSERFNLTALSAGVVGDDFDPTLAIPSIYFDTDNSGDFSGGDVAYNAGVNDPILAADASVRLLVINSIPNTAVNGNRGRSQLTAAAATGTGAPGTAFIGLGDGGVDAVAGTTGGDAVLFGEYLLADVQLTAVKSQTIVDQFGGARPLPGARINYQVVVTASGSGTATAAAFSDLIPANTDYVAGSLQLNGARALRLRRPRRRHIRFRARTRSAGHPRQSHRRFRAADDRVRRDHPLRPTTLRSTRQEKGR